MKHVIIGIAAIAITATACNNGNNSTAENKKNDSAQTSASEVNQTTTATNGSGNINSSVKEMLGQYLQLKNALANDNSKDAATAGEALVSSASKMETASLTAEQKKVWGDVSDDLKEMAEHIGKSAEKIDHQREHFDMLSQDMYEVVKAFGAGQTLYKDFCPMYNDNKGASWLSETKEIKNPYLGQKMAICGTVKEEIKQ